jgi:hypothetical protein
VADSTSCASWPAAAVAAAAGKAGVSRKCRRRSCHRGGRREGPRWPLDGDVVFRSGNGVLLMSDERKKPEPGRI